MTGQEGKLPHRNHPVHLTRRLAFVRLTIALDFLFGFALAVDFFLAFGLIRSGSVADPFSNFRPLKSDDFSGGLPVFRATSKQIKSD
jgi:hypothetical protein